jgi:hypothetical protein
VRLAISMLTIAFAVATAGVALGQPDNKGHGRGNPQGGGPSNAANQPGGGPQVSISVSERDRNEVYSYYRGQYAAGHCPPGLAKKNNGCMPPGQAKKAWTMNQPLPAGVVYEVLPRDLLGRLSPAPSGYQYVRVANDVLMMAVGTRLIVGALADLSAF